jgi:hypothetical protein
MANHMAQIHREHLSPIRKSAEICRKEISLGRYNTISEFPYKSLKGISAAFSAA